MKTKKLFITLLIFAFILMIFSFVSNVEAQSLGNLTTIKERKEGEITYRHQLYGANPDQVKNVWNLVTCNPDGTPTDLIPDIYCLRAGLGFTSIDLDHKAVEYTTSYEMTKQYEELVQKYNGGIQSDVTIFKAENKDKFNAVMWILDNMLLENATDEQLTQYLKDYAGYTDGTLTQTEFKENVLTRADIEVIQQLAIWYFTNDDEEDENSNKIYSNDTLPAIYMSIDGDEIFGTKGKYETYQTIYNAGELYGTQRQKFANTLYTSLIAKAKQTADELKQKNAVYEPERDITVYLAGTNLDEQPVVNVKESEKEVDVALRKFISAVNGVKLEGESSREPNADTTKLNTEIGNNLQTTAEYNHTKKPVKVSKGDIVTYTLRLYNEGEIDTYIKEVTDYLPKYLEYVPYGDDKGAWWELDEETARIAVGESCIVTGVGGNIDSGEVGKVLGDVLIPAAEYIPANKETGEPASYKLSYVDIQISCKVMSTAHYDENITNLAQITKMTDDKGNVIEEDRDSKPNGNFNLPSDENLPGYKDDESNRLDYVPGQEDDDDFEKVVIEVPEIDLALRKFISAVGDTKYNRAPTVVTDPLKQGQNTAVYNHSKEPIGVEIGDIVTYTLRLYNEGDIDGRVKEVTDHLDKNLEYVAYGNDKNGDWWKASEEKGEAYNTIVSTENCVVVGVSENLSSSNVGRKLGDVVIPAYDKEKDILSYVDIEVHCKVLPVEEEIKLTNIAEITKQADEYGEEIDKDRDSVPNGNLNLPSDFPGYKDDEIGKKDYIPGQEDDDDFEKVKVKIPQIDVALRKFISAVGDTKYNRAPTVVTSGLKQGEDTAIYNHSKVPVEVEIGDVVTYTLRLYNEGEVNAIVKEVADHLDKNLKYVAFGEDKNADWWRVTEETGDAYNTIVSTENCIVTGVSENMNSSNVGKKLNEVIIPAYDKEKDVLSYIDIEVHCQVMPVKTALKLTNIAEITKQADETGTDVDKDRDSVPDGNLDLPKDFPGYKDDEIGKKDYIPGQEDDDDFEKVIVVVPEIDLSLRKFITEVDGEKIETSREPKVDTNKIDNHTDTTSEYNHSKKPVTVKRGSLVTYTIRVYNEGEIDAFASEVTDYLPKYLNFLPDNEINKKYGWEYDEKTREVKTTITAKENTAGDEVYKERENGKLLLAYDGNGELNYIDIEIVCEIDEKAEGSGILTNLAQITEEEDEEGKKVEEDRDSKPDDNFELPEDKDRPNYKDEDSDKDYVPGQEDDDDFEKVIVVVPEMDLSLRKYISKVDGEEVETSREPKVDTNKIDKHTDTTSEYDHPKKPVMVKRGSLVTYTIRVYNEGEIDAFASEVTDYLPKYLNYLPDNETNKKYGWEYDEKTREVKTTITAKENTAGDEVYKERENGKLLLAYDGNGELNYIDVEIVCEIDEKAEGNGILTNLAQITEEEDEEGKKVEEDRDSKPDDNFELPEDKDRPNYKDEDSDKDYVPGQEDDDDFEKVQIKPDFDLALRKFITKVENTNVNNRYPEVEYKDGKLSYKHTKTPVELTTGDTVIYTIRVYNEGEADGYANEITDDVPEGLEFLPENETNKEYRWKMLDENEEETTDVSKAKYIITDYLSEEQEKEAQRDNKIKAFNKEGEITDKNPDYRDVKIAFKVTYEAKTKDEEARTIVNTAQISKDSDDDIDSKPNRDEVYNHDNDKDNEDDIDYDQVKVKYFDLSLLKWVTKTMVTLNGKTQEIKSGHTAETSRNEDPVKLEVKSKDVNKIKVKYAYTIRVTNEGEIAGYATEVTDYIPEGLKFVKEDNPDWYELGEGKIGTKKLENKLLKPGESAEVEVILTWINGKENFGEKVNIAEISEDKNDEGVPDVDSTPDNQKAEEDDIDDAPSIITVKTGVGQIYVGLILIILVTFAGGISLIKKYVLE